MGSGLRGSLTVRLVLQVRCGTAIFGGQNRARARLAPRVLPAASWLPALSCPLWAVGGASEFV